MPADDASPFMQLAETIVLGQVPSHARRQPVAFRTLFTSLDHSDAICAGLDGAEQELGEDGGFAIHFDGRSSIPSVTLELMDGQIVGLRAIREARKALEEAEKLAERLEGAR